MKILKKIFSFEPIIIWIRYFLTVTSKSIISNFVIPLIICILLGIFRHEVIIENNFDIFTIGSILIGFCSSILIMLFSIDGENITKLKQTQLLNKKISLYQALVYKFAFITINLVVLIFIGILGRFAGFDNFLFFKLYIIFIFLNSTFILLEALTNVIFCLISNKKFK